MFFNNWLRNLLECIDRILSSIPEKHKLCDVASDHNMVYTCIDVDVKVVKHKTIKFRDYKHFNEDAFLEDVESSLVLKNCHGKYLDDESLWTTWCDEFIKICDNHTPLKND